MGVDVTVGVDGDVNSDVDVYLDVTMTVYWDTDVDVDVYV